MSDSDGTLPILGRALSSPLTRRSLLAGAGSTLLLAACGSSASPNKSAGGSSGTTAGTGAATTLGGSAPANPVNKTMRVGVASLEEQYPDPMGVVGGLLYPVGLWSVGEGLANLNLSGRVVPGMASGWTTSADGLTWTFTLRQGITFQDGTPFTANDFKTSVDRLKLNLPRFIGYVAFEAVFDSLDVIDDFHVAIKLKTPYSSLPSAIPPPISTTYYNKVGETTFENHPIAAGPFKFVSQQLNSSMTFAKYDGFWDKSRLPNFDNLILNIIPDQSSMVAGIQTGQIDLACSLAPESAAQLEGSSNIRLLRDPGAAQGVVYFVDNWNTKEPSPYKDVRVRKALLLAIDRQGIANSLYKGYGEVPANVTFAETLGNDASLKPYPYDPAQAKALLKAAGQENLSIDFTSYSATSSVPNVQTLVQAVAAYWKQIGVKVNLTFLDAETYLPKVRDHAYRGAIILGSPAITFFDPLNYYIFYKTTGPYSTLSDPAMDQVFDQLATLSDQTAKAALATKMARMLYDGLWGLPIVGVDSVHAIGPHVASWQLMQGNPYSGPFWKLEAK